jgi:copper chaperone
MTAVAFLSLFGIGSAAAQKDRAIEDQRATLKVEGMACGVCAGRVEKTALGIDGVKAAKASQRKGTAEITFDPAKTNPGAIAASITSQTPFKAQVPKKGQKER